MTLATASGTRKEPAASPQSERKSRRRMLLLMLGAPPPSQIHLCVITEAIDKQRIALSPKPALVQAAAAKRRQ